MTEPESVVVQPGDTLVIRVCPDTSAEEIERMSAQARAALPEGARVLYTSAEQIGVNRRSTAAGGTEYVTADHR